MSDTATVVHGEHSHEQHDPNLQHHFATFEQQLDASKIGMWLCRRREIGLFGGCEVHFGLLEANFPDAVVKAPHSLDKNLGLRNIVGLLISFLNMVRLLISSTTVFRKPRFLSR